MVTCVLAFGSPASFNFASEYTACSSHFSVCDWVLICRNGMSRLMSSSNVLDIREDALWMRLFRHLPHESDMYS